jgi:hypothetical protein
MKFCVCLMMSVTFHALKRLPSRMWHEIPMVGVAPAVYDAVGVWCNQIPLTPERVWRGMKQKMD